MLRLPIRARRSQALFNSRLHRYAFSTTTGTGDSIDDENDTTPKETIDVDHDKDVVQEDASRL